MAKPVNKVIIDSSVYIPYINEGRTHPLLEYEFGTPLIYMSAVVFQELYSGASDNATMKLVDKLFKTFDSLGRIVTPSASDWRIAGKTIAKLGKKYGFEKLFLSKIVNDVLIALSARKIGGVVVTRNTKDFLRIKEFINFSLSQ